MFRGHFEHAVDDKGRVAIPARFREALTGLQDERLIVAKGLPLDGRRWLDVYPLAAWRQVEKKMLAKRRFDRRARVVRNFLVSGSHECTLDGQGRILVPPLLREYVGLSKDVMFTGEIDTFRIWDKEAWERAYAEDERLLVENPEIFDELDL